jgi:hypothetical protein
LLLWSYLSGFRSTVDKWTFYRDKDDIRTYCDHAVAAYGGVSLFSTSSGFIGLGPATGRPGDVMTVLPMCRQVVVLRQTGANWTFQGLAWVHGIMHGELGTFWDKKKLEESSIVLQ